ncbi:hypothetical protein F4802DRAFT_593956 [Xylaria palmicola]|nr:hypothetical protein F4802DRAFT_593956 [Xylaria palmicola]
MKFSCFLVLLSPLPALSAAEIVVDFDPTLENRVDVHIKVEEVVGYAFLEAQFSKPKNGTKKNTGEGAIEGAAETSSLLDSRAVLNVLAGSKRAAYCDEGYGYCSNFGRCCALNLNCCGYGYCIEEDDRCCPNRPCEAGEGCCGQNHCYPLGGDCCSDESHCSPGNACYRLAASGRLVCCTDAACTAHVEPDGSTSYASTTTSTRTYTTTRTQYYYWTVTWWYWYYYWTYSYAIEASIVTSTQSTTSSVLSVLTTDADAASSYFSEMSSTIDLPTPAGATSLESLAGSTSLGDLPSSTSTSESDFTTGRAAPTTAGSSDNGDNGGSGLGDGLVNNAPGLWSQLDGFTVGFLTFSTAVGLTAALL